MALVLNDRVLDNGLSVLDLECNAIYVCHTQPTNYTEATSTFALGSKAIGVGSVFGTPADETTIGRKVASVLVDDGGNAASGTPIAWAAVDTVNSRLLATGPLNGGVPFTGGVFDLTPMTIVQPFSSEGDEPISLATPVVTGTVADGMKLNSTSGDWAGEGLVITQQWYEVLRDNDGVPLTDNAGVQIGGPILGATATYHVIEAPPMTAESTWNEYDRTQSYIGYLTNNNLTAYAPGSLCVRGTRPNSTGKRYFEMIYDAVSYLYMFCGLLDDTAPLFIALQHGYINNKGVGCSILSSPGQFSAVAQLGATSLYHPDPVPWASGDVLGFAADLTARVLWVSRNGVWLGTGSAGAPIIQNPVTGQGGINWGTATKPDMKPFVEVYGNSGHEIVNPPCVVTLNSGATPFAFGPPATFIAWGAP
jgi:hypothetical protein